MCWREFSRGGEGEKLWPLSALNCEMTWSLEVGHYLFQSSLANADDRKCLCVKLVWCLTLQGQLSSVSTYPLSPQPYNSPSPSLCGPVSSYLWQHDQREQEEQYCVCAQLCTRPAAKQMFGGGILVAGLAPGPGWSYSEWLHKHSLGRSKEQIALYRKLYGNGIISTPIKVCFSLPLPSCRLFILLLQQKEKCSVAQGTNMHFWEDAGSARADSLIYATFSVYNCY